MAPGEMRGHCLCGAVRFTARPEKAEFGACHCAMCRRWTAGPFLAVECGGSVRVEDPASVAIFRSSEWAERHFCKACGTALFYKLASHDYYVVSLEALEDPSGLAFTSQIFIDEKSTAYEFANATRNMTGAEVFAAFAASQEGDNG